MHTRALLLMAAGIASLATAVITPTAAPSPRARRWPKPIKLKLPPAKALPAGTVTIMLGKHNTKPDQTLVATGDAVWTARGPFRIAEKNNAVTGPFAHGRLQDVGVGFGSVVGVRLLHRHGPQARRTDGRPSEGHTRSAQLGARGHRDRERLRVGRESLRRDRLSHRLRRRTPSWTPFASAYTGRGGAQKITAGLGSLWVGVGNKQAVVRVDPRANKIAATIQLPRSVVPCGGIAVSAAAVWVTSCLELKTVARIDPRTNTVASILDVGGVANQPAADGNTVWLVASGNPYDSRR